MPTVTLISRARVSRARTSRSGARDTCKKSSVRSVEVAEVAKLPMKTPSGSLAAASAAGGPEGLSGSLSSKDKSCWPTKRGGSQPISGRVTAGARPVTEPTEGARRQRDDEHAHGIQKSSKQNTQKKTLKRSTCRPTHHGALRATSAVLPLLRAGAASWCSVHRRARWWISCWPRARQLTMASMWHW